MMASLAPKWFLPSQRWIAFLGISTISTKISDVISNALDTTSLDLISHCHYFHIYLWSVLHCSTFKVAGYFETCICSEQYKCSKLAHTQCTAFILDFGSLSIGSPQEIVQHGFRGRYIVQCIQLLTLFSLSPSMYLVWSVKSKKIWGLLWILSIWKQKCDVLSWLSFWNWCSRI